MRCNAQACAFVGFNDATTLCTRIGTDTHTHTHMTTFTRGCACSPLNWSDLICELYYSKLPIIFSSHSPLYIWRFCICICAPIAFIIRGRRRRKSELPNCKAVRAKPDDCVRDACLCIIEKRVHRKHINYHGVDGLPPDAAPRTLRGMPQPVYRHDNTLTHAQHTTQCSAQP